MNIREQFITYGTAKMMVTNIPYDKAEEISKQIENLDSVIMLTFDNSAEHYNNFSALYDITFGYEETDERALEALDTVGICCRITTCMFQPVWAMLPRNRSFYFRRADHKRHEFHYGHDLLCV